MRVTKLLWFFFFCIFLIAESGANAVNHDILKHLQGTETEKYPEIENLLKTLAKPLTHAMEERGHAVKIGKIYLVDSAVINAVVDSSSKKPEEKKAAGSSKIVDV